MTNILEMLAKDQNIDPAFSNLFKPRKELSMSEKTEKLIETLEVRETQLELMILNLLDEIKSHNKAMRETLIKVLENSYKVTVNGEHH